METFPLGHVEKSADNERNLRNEVIELLQDPKEKQLAEALSDLDEASATELDRLLDADSKTFYAFRSCEHPEAVVKALADWQSATDPAEKQERGRKLLESLHL